MADHRAKRVLREQRTVALMIGMYCRAGHPCATGEAAGEADAADTVPGAAPTTAGAAPATSGAVPTVAPALCPACAALTEYSRLRVEQCRFGEDKPTCAHCAVHCFRPQMREQIRAVMRYSGPRMTLRHPYLALRHLLDRRRPAA